jgi:hypothetical protein
MSELQIKIDNARNKDRTLPSKDEVVMTATDPTMIIPSGAIGEIASGNSLPIQSPRMTITQLSCEKDLDPGMSFTPAHNQADLASRFDHAPWETIRKENVLMWLSWICLDLPLHQGRESEQHLKCLQETLEKIELEIGMIIPNGFDPKIKVHRPSLDPVVVSGRTSK